MPSPLSRTSISTPPSAVTEAIEYLIENTFTKMSYLKFLHENPLKEIGVFDVSVHLHGDLEVTTKVWVVQAKPE